MIECRLCRVPAGAADGVAYLQQAIASPDANGRGPSERISYDGPVKKGDINSDWFPYAVAAAAAIVIAVGRWVFGVWHGV
jgi:hypothetical protein